MAADWDVDSYRTDYESDEHWELRKNFMLAHKDSLPEDEIVCLAQVFTNIELLGCRYPEATMIRVAELAKGIVESFREKKKNSLKRTFITASRAANGKVKGFQTAEKIEKRPGLGSKKMKIDSEQNHFNNNFRYDKNAPSPLISRIPVAPDFQKSSKSTARDSFLSKSHLPRLKGPFRDFILLLEDNERPTDSLIRNALLNRCKLSWTFNEMKTRCSAYLNDQLVSSGEGINIKTSRDSAAAEAVKSLQSSCYTVKIKEKFTSSYTVQVSDINGSIAKEPQRKSVGADIMKLMGWTGGGLGIKEQGILEPVNTAMQFNREGLGSIEDNLCGSQFRDKATLYIKAWLQKNSEEDLVFSPDFTDEERKIMHQIAVSLTLKSRSYGKDEKRHLVISKKISPWEIVSQLAEAGGSTSKYELIVPNVT